MVELFLIVVGSIAHGLYKLTNESLIIGLFAPTDESLWEHFKLGWTATLLLIPVERWLLHRGGSTYAFARAVGFLALNVAVVIIFFGLRPLVPEGGRLAVDIGSYIVGCLVMGQIIRRWSNEPSRVLSQLGVPLLIAIGVLLAVLTYWRPAGAIFVEHHW